MGITLVFAFDAVNIWPALLARGDEGRMLTNSFSLPFTAMKALLASSNASLTTQHITVALHEKTHLVDAQPS